ncbi:MAG: hypothetical protein O7E55_10355, partial [Chloroflexi bacterium]|nr:hypothetical protein [Chloroflexota bacterium]
RSQNVLGSLYSFPIWYRGLGYLRIRVIYGFVGGVGLLPKPEESDDSQNGRHQNAADRRNDDN